MKYREIKLENNKSVLVDESGEIKENDLFYSEFKGEKRILRFNKQVSPFPNDKKIIASINHSIDLDVAMVIVEDESLNQEYIELEELRGSGGHYDENNTWHWVILGIKTNRVDGQLMAYVKK